MADRRHLENRINCHISAKAWAIYTKFGTVTHIDTPKSTVVTISKFKNSNMADGRHFEKSTNGHIYRQWFDRLMRNVAWWVILTLRIIRMFVHPTGVRGTPFPPLLLPVPSTFSFFLFVTFSLSSFVIHFTYFLLLSIPSLATSIVTRCI